MTLSVLFEDSRIAQKLSSLEGIDRVISYDPPFSEEAVNKDKWICLMPPVFRSGDEKKPDINTASRGVMVRTYDELGYLSDISYKGEIIADASLYSFNSYSTGMLEKAGVTQFTCPSELNSAELLKRGGLDKSTLVIYGRAPLMVSAQCVNKNVKEKCFNDKKMHITYLKDRKGAMLPVMFNCGYCVNVIYNSVPTSLHKDMDKIREMGIEDFRIDITTEKEEEAASLIEYYVNLINGNYSSDAPAVFTHGHFIKSVE